MTAPTAEDMTTNLSSKIHEYI